VFVGAIGSYLVTPRGNPTLLFAGAILVFVAVVVNSFAYRTAPASRPKVPKAGLWVCLLAGILFSGFGPLLANALSSSHPVSPYGVNILFTFGAPITTIPGIGYFMRHPVEGDPLSGADYRKGRVREHAAGLLGGFV
jgi:glucose uptake protein